MSFFQFFYKNPILLCPYLVKKRIFCQNYTLLWAIKVNKMPFFPRFLLKNGCSHNQFILKIQLIFKEKTALKSMFCQKTFIPSKTLCSHVIFFLVFFEKSPAVKPIFGKKTSVLSNYTIFWVKKVNRMPVFSDFSRKNNSSNAHILSKNRPFSENNLLLSPYVKKTSILTKTN